MCTCDGPSPEFQRTTVQRARREYRCEECRRLIRVGARYAYSVGKYDGYLENSRLCLRCEALARAVSSMSDCCWPIGELMAFVSEQVREEYIDRDLLCEKWRHEWAKLAGLIRMSNVWMGLPIDHYPYVTGVDGNGAPAYHARVS